ncbi:Spermatogenesis-associated protein 1 [Paragonimus westermani]|uniref:Spermatogenesis-associated protein 1 n=1 Tax=Paragonimus westermani TaxID=34504 RepID=A0A8T0DJJ8_9TREM|nr:Spermatogenesis-associated protein 1 [Paragonimus westermani]
MIKDSNEVEEGHSEVEENQTELVGNGEEINEDGGVVEASSDQPDQNQVESEEAGENCEENRNCEEDPNNAEQIQNQTAENWHKTAEDERQIDEPQVEVTERNQAEGGHSPIENCAIPEEEVENLNSANGEDKPVTPCNSLREMNISPEADLHVYVVPALLWNRDLNTAFSELFKETASVGIIRPDVNMTLAQFRDRIESELTFDFLPKEYVFCKSVGHSLGRTEYSEVYVLDKNALKNSDEDDSRQRDRMSQVVKPKSVSLRTINPQTGTLDLDSHRVSSVAPQWNNSNEGTRMDLPQVLVEGRSRPSTPSVSNARYTTDQGAPYIHPGTYPNEPPRQSQPYTVNGQPQSQPQQWQQPRQSTVIPPQEDRPQATTQAGRQLYSQEPQPLQTQQQRYPQQQQYQQQQQHQQQQYLEKLLTSPRPGQHVPSPLQNSGDPALEMIVAAIDNQREMLYQLENQQQRRLLQMRAEAEERRRLEAEAYERELAEKAKQLKRLEMLEEELRRCTAEAKAAREELMAAKKLWETALEAKESEVTMLRENLDLMRANSSGKETAAMAAAKAELNEVRAQLKMMQDRYTEVQEELEKRRKIAEERLQNVSDDVNLLRRKLSLVYEAVKEPPKVEVITVAPEHKDTKTIGVGVE